MEQGAERDVEAAGLVLAAGRSRRMGASKPLLEIGGRTFLRATVEALREGGCAPVVAVVAGAEAEEEALRAGAVPVVGRPGEEQVDSLRAGLNALDRTLDGVVVLPVDHPLVRPTTVGALRRRARGSPDAVVRPVYDGEAGHPTYFPRSTWPALRDPHLAHGARSVVESPDTERVDVRVDDPGVVADIDTPEAYSRHVGGMP